MVQIPFSATDFLHLVSNGISRFCKLVFAFYAFNDLALLLGYREEYLASSLLWSPYVIGQTIIFSSCFFFFLLLLFFSSPNLSGRRLDVYHTLAHDVALVRI